MHAFLALSHARLVATDSVGTDAQGYGISITEHVAMASAGYDWMAQCQELLRFRGFVRTPAQVVRKPGTYAAAPRAARTLYLSHPL